MTDPPDFRAVLERYRGGSRGALPVGCVACHDTGWYEGEGGSGLRPCLACRDHTRTLTHAGVPANVREATLEGVKNHLRGYAGRVLSAIQGSGRGYVLQGPVGSGKTFLMGAACQWAAEKGVSVRWEKASRIMELLDEAWSGEGVTEADVLNPLRAVDVLAIDDLGAHRVSEAVVHRLEDILDDRTAGYEGYAPPEWRGRKAVVKGRPFARKRQVWVTTNYSPANIEKIFGLRFASRLKLLEWIELPADLPDLR